MTGPNPTDRGKPGSKRHIAVDARGTPLGVLTGRALQHDSQMLAPVLDAIPPVRSGRRGRPRQRPHKLHADLQSASQPAPPGGSLRDGL